MLAACRSRQRAGSGWHDEKRKAADSHKARFCATESKAKHPTQKANVKGNDRTLARQRVRHRTKRQRQRQRTHTKAKATSKPRLLACLHEAAVEGLNGTNVVGVRLRERADLRGRDGHRSFQHKPLDAFGAWRSGY